MTKKQLERFANCLGQGWEFRQDSELGYGIYRNIKRVGWPKQVPPSMSLKEIDDIVKDELELEQQNLIANDTNGLVVCGRSGGWIGWPFSDLLCEHEDSAWGDDEFGTIVEEVREEVISAATNIDHAIARVSRQKYWDKVFAEYTKEACTCVL